MIWDSALKLFSFVGRIGASPTDSAELRDLKVLFVAIILFFDIPMSIIQSVFYALSHKNAASLLNAGWAAFDLINIIYFGVRGII